MVCLVKRVKVNYTISGYSKYQLGEIVAEDETHITVLSEVTGDTVRIARRCIDELVVK